MRGLRTQETNKFKTFFEIVQKAAQEREAVFFLDSGDGNAFDTENMEGENLQGWLVPLKKADEFEKVWVERAEDDEWVDFFCWAEWIMEENKIDVKFTAENNNTF